MVSAEYPDPGLRTAPRGYTQIKAGAEQHRCDPPPVRGTLGDVLECTECGQRWKCVGSGSGDWGWAQVRRPAEIFFLVLLALVGIAAGPTLAVIFG